MRENGGFGGIVARQPTRESMRVVVCMCVLLFMRVFEVKIRFVCEVSLDILTESQKLRTREHVYSSFSLMYIYIYIYYSILNINRSQFH